MTQPGVGSNYQGNVWAPALRCGSQQLVRSYCQVHNIKPSNQAFEEPPSCGLCRPTSTCPGAPNEEIDTFLMSQTLDKLK